MLDRLNDEWANFPCEAVTVGYWSVAYWPFWSVRRSIADTDRTTRARLVAPFRDI